MTSPKQGVPDLVGLLGYGAFTVADPKGGRAPGGPYGQAVNEAFVRSLVKGNLPSLASGITGVNTAIAQLKKTLLDMPADSLYVLDGLIPGIPAGAFTTKSGAVDAITGSLNVNPTKQTDTTVKQITDILGGVSVSSPDNDAVLNAQAYVTQAQAQHQGLVSQLFGGLKQTTASGNTSISTADVGNAASATSANAANAKDIAEENAAVLAIRNNKSILSGIDETEESNYSLTDLYSGGADPAAIISATASNVPIAYWRATEYTKKGFISWFGKGFTNVTSLVIDIYKANYSASRWDLIYTSANLVGQVGSAWSYLQHTIPSANRIDVAPGDVYGIGWRVTGTGTHSIGGKKAGSWFTNHPTSPAPKQPASSRTGSGNLAFSSTTYTADTPWFGIGIVSGDAAAPVLAPRSEEFRTPGSFTYTIPEQFRVAGYKIDRVAVGGGGGGNGSLIGLGGKGGSAGTWAADTLVYGTDIPLGTTTLNIVVGPGGPGGLTPNDGGDSTSSQTGVPTLTAAKGLVGQASSGYGESPGDFIWNNAPYAGGLTQTRTGGAGFGPGGGGAQGGILLASGHGAAGGVFITARQI